MMQNILLSAKDPQQVTVVFAVVSSTVRSVRNALNVTLEL